MTLGFAVAADTGARNQENNAQTVIRNAAVESANFFKSLISKIYFSLSLQENANNL